MNLLYNVSIRIMSGGVRVAALKSQKLNDMIEGQRQTLTQLRKSLNSAKGYDIWFHAASLGEFEQARPLIEGYRKNHPDRKILLTFFSPSGYHVRRNYPLVDCVTYLPFDTPGNVKEFLDTANPGTAVFIKYEFWGNYLSQLHRLGIPTYLVSAIFRPGQSFFKPWGGMFRKMLRNYTRIFVQDEASRQLLEQINVCNLSVTGDTRFDRVHEIMTNAQSIPVIDKWLESHKGLKIVVGSSWDADEKCYIKWLNDHPETKAIIAPHEFDDQRLSKITLSLQGKTCLWSQLKADGGSVTDQSAMLSSDTQVLIIDCFGLLSTLYRYGDAAIIGGGFGAGIHNINEAAVYGIPVAFGPNHKKFKEATDLISKGGAQTYSNSAQLHQILDSWLQNPEKRRAAGKIAGDYISGHLGATPQILSFIDPS